MLRISGIVRESIVDGPGIRFVVFTQGCPHACPGCHNPDTHSAQGGYNIDVQKIYDEFVKNPLLKGITFSGGEPMLQPAELLVLAQMVAALGKDIAIYSGYTFEELLEMAAQKPEILELLKLSNFLVDGRFILAQRDLTLTFRGSRNQRIINPALSLQTGGIVLLDLDIN